MTLARPDPGNLIATIDALVDTVNAGSGGGGGSAFSDLLSISNDSSFANFPDSAPQVIGWDSGAVGGALYRTNGTAISWDIADPTHLTINTDGYYDFDASLAVSNSGAAGIYGFGLYYINGVPTNYTLPSQVFIPQDVSVNAIQARLKRIHLLADDYVEVAGLIVGDATVTPQELLVVATRVA